jgi:RimJ/RimL family protein N-acetyltransferase
MEFSLSDVEMRPPHPRDAVDALALLTDPDVAQWHPAPKVVDLDSAIEWCVRGADWSDGSHFTWHALDTASGRLLANCSVFAVDRDNRSCRIAYRVAPWARNLGVGRFVVSALSQWTFAHEAMTRISLEHAIANPASCRVAIASGYALEGVERSAYVDAHDRAHDCHLHARLVSDDVVPVACSLRVP